MQAYTVFNRYAKIVDFVFQFHEHVTAIDL